MREPARVLGGREVVPAVPAGRARACGRRPAASPKMPELAIETRVNGELRQQASTKMMIYDLAGDRARRARRTSDGRCAAAT